LGYEEVRDYLAKRKMEKFLVLMEKFPILVMTIVLYLASAVGLLVGAFMMYAAYRDSDFKLSLLALLVFVGSILILNTARKK